MGEAKRRRLAGEMPPRDQTAFNRSQALYALLGAMNENRGKSPTTPSTPLSERVRAFCATLSDAAPVMLPHVKTNPAHVSGACHLNVLEQVRSAGGRRVMGWMIWDCPGWTEAEFHAVWESPDGELVDVTPRVDGEPTILFVPDPVTRIVRGPAGDLIPTNRTTIRGCPYTYRGSPSPRPAQETIHDQPTRARMAALGLSSVE